MVLGMAMLITVIGVGALMASRVTTRSVGVNVDWEEAGSLAFSACEHAIARLNGDAAANPTTWRNNYTSGAVAFTGSFGRGTIKWVLIDEVDGNFSNDYGDSIRLYGVGVVGTTKRVYSVQLQAGGDGLDALRCAFHSSGGLKLTDSTVVLGGPVSTNGDINNADKQVGGTGNETAGSGGTTAPAKPMPQPGVFNLYKAKATTIATSNASGGTLAPGTLSATSNPYGAANPDGIYYLRLPDGISKLTIASCHIKGTLLIENAAGNTSQSLTISAPAFWEPNSTGYATLITKGIDSISVNGSQSAFNDGSTDYFSEVRGLFHTIGSTDVQFKDKMFLRGCWIADGVISTSTAMGVLATPSLKTTPPMGYNMGNKLTPVGGTWKWDAPPAGT
jgi:hypothetical protein